MDINFLMHGLRELGSKANPDSFKNILRESRAKSNRKIAVLLRNMATPLESKDAEGSQALLYAAEILNQDADRMEAIARSPHGEPFTFRPFETAPRDGSEILARWSNTEHGHRYHVIYFVKSENMWFDRDIPVEGMDSWCYLPRE